MQTAFEIISTLAHLVFLVTVSSFQLFLTICSLKGNRYCDQRQTQIYTCKSKTRLRTSLLSKHIYQPSLYCPIKGEEKERIHANEGVQRTAEGSCSWDRPSESSGMEPTLLLPEALKAVPSKSHFLYNQLLWALPLSSQNPPQRAPVSFPDLSPSHHCMAKRHEARAFPHLKAHPQRGLLGFNMFSTCGIWQGLVIWHKDAHLNNTWDVGFDPRSLWL